MTSTKERKKTVKKIVLYFDICSSCSILEDLLRTENQKRWRDLLIGLKNFLRRKGEKPNYEIYKFLGDGWILLFESELKGKELIEFLKELCLEFKKQYNKRVEPVIETKIDVVGMTFGLDTGTLVYMTMNGRKEYMGRPLNIAARLQGSVKDKDSKPQYKVLMSKTLFTSFTDSLKKEYKITNVTRNLRNISGGKNYLCKKLVLLKPEEIK